MGLAKHVRHLVLGHVDPVLLEERCDFTHVERAAPICIELLEHVVNNVVGLDLSACAEVVRVCVLHSSGSKPLFEDRCLEL